MIFYNRKYRTYIGTLGDFRLKEGVPKNYVKMLYDKNKLIYQQYATKYRRKGEPKWVEGMLEDHPNKITKDILLKWYKEKVFNHYLSIILPVIISIVAFVVYFFGIEYPQNILPSIVGPILILWFFHKEPECV